MPIHFGRIYPNICKINLHLQHKKAYCCKLKVLLNAFFFCGSFTNPLNHCNVFDMQLFSCCFCFAYKTAVKGVAAMWTFSGFLIFTFRSINHILCVWSPCSQACTYRQWHFLNIFINVLFHSYCSAQFTKLAIRIV